MFYTDDRGAFAKALLGDPHIAGKIQMSNTRHHLRRVALGSKVISKKEEVVDNTIKMWCALKQPDVFRW